MKIGLFKVICILLLLNYCSTKQSNTKLLNSYNDSCFDVAVNELENYNLNKAKIGFEYLINRKINDTLRLNCYFNLGVIYSDKNQQDSAIYFYSLAEKISEKTHDTLTQYQLLNNKAIIFKNKGEFKKAITYLQKSKYYFEKDTNYHQELLNTLTLLGNTYKDIDNFQLSLDYLKKAKETAIQFNNKKGENASINNIGNLYFKNEIYDSAFVYFSSYKQKSKSYKNKHPIALMNLGKTLTKLNKFELAKQNLDSARLLYVELKDTISMLNYKICLADFFIQKKEFDFAFNELNEIIKHSKIKEYPKIKIEALELLEKYYTITKQGDKKNIVKLDVIKIKDSIFSLKEINQIHNIERAALEQNFNETTNSINIEFARTKIIFIGALLLLIMGLIYSYILFRKRKKKLLLLTLEKDEIIKSENIKNLTQKGLIIGKFQPQHALAGILNEINALIEMEEYEAAKLKAKESGKFLRQLIYANKGESNLASEIQNIKTLLEYESKQREFEYNINIDSNVEKHKDKVKLPSLILFIPLYNAIEYAIGHEKNGKIEFALKIENNNLNCEIKDTGKKSLDVKTELQEYRGIGSLLMNDYLKIQEELTGRKGMFEIVQKHNNSVKTGNTTLLTIPLNLQ